jgi:hypothetical protein
MGETMKARSTRRERAYEPVDIQGTTVWLPEPDPIPDTPFVAQEEIIEKALAAWTHLDGVPRYGFRLYGPPGVGKNAIVYELARRLGRDLYIIQGPEDIVCTITPGGPNNGFQNRASTLFAAMYRGGIAFFDEIGKVPAYALATLAPVLDERQVVTSVASGLHVPAHDDFLFCAALNEDEEVGTGLPGFINERTRPAIRVGLPASGDLMKILTQHFPAMEQRWIHAFMAEFRDTPLSPRVALILLGYTYKLCRLPDSSSPDLSDQEIRRRLRAACTEMHVPGSDPEDSPEQSLSKDPDQGEASRDACSTTRNKQDAVH